VTVDGPAGVTGAGVGVWFAEEEPQPDTRHKPIARKITHGTLHQFLRFTRKRYGTANIARTAASEPELAPPRCLPTPELGRAMSSDAEFTFVVIVNVVVATAPLGVSVTGEKLHAVAAGRPEHAKDVEALKPPLGVMLIVVVVELPGATLALDGESDIAKSGGGETTICTGSDTEAALFVSPR